MDEKVSATKQKLLDVSRQLMMSKGYNATTVEEVCKAAEVTKGAFFHYFKSKEALGVSVLNEYWHTRQRQFAEVVSSQDDPIAQVQDFLRTVADVFMHDPDGYSCLAGSFAQELAATNPMFQTLVSGLFAEWTQQIKPLLQAAKERAQLPDRIDVDIIADHIVAVVEGALILALARQDRRVLAVQIDVLSEHLEMLLVR